MKKYFNKIVFAVSIIGIMGFGECTQAWYALWGISLNGLGTGFLNTTTDAGSEIEFYSIAVGELGTIYTGEGKSPSFWVERSSGTAQNLNFVRVYDYYPDSLITYAVGDGGTVLLSRDKGLTWVDRSIPGLTRNLYGLDYFDVFQGVGVVVCGDSGIICISTDSGISWTQHNAITTNKFNSIMAYGGDNFIAVGDNGTIIKGGPQFGWYNKSVDSNINLYKIFSGIGLAYSKLWVVGSNGKIYYSTDYGESWGTQNSGVTTDLYGIQFRNENDGIIVGENGVVRYTSNSGYTWNEDTYLSGLTTRDIISIAGVDSNTASCLTVNNYNGDSRGTDTTFFLAVSSEPLVDVKNENTPTPTEYQLLQNYPNPFNPTTNISWQSPVSGRQSIKMYDALGRELETIVEGYYDAGDHSKLYIAKSTLPSGVYFYKLQAGSYSETKKMILMK
jgi:photosystem II stability/assembly factor-like uncharacterized protein